MRQGSHQLLALNVESGQVEWQFRAPGPDAVIAEHYLAAPERILLQSSAGELLALDAADGRLVYRKRAAVPWPGPPILIDAGQAVYADGPVLHALELDTGHERWARSPPGLASLSGAAPQLRRDGSHLLVVSERNYGWDFERLFIADGKRDLGPIFLGRERIDLFRSAIAPEAYALHAPDRIIALDRDGKQIWALPIPWRGAEHWHVRAATKAIIVCPDGAILVVNPDAVVRLAAREVWPIPTFGGFQRAASTLYHGATRRTFPLLAVTARDGKKIQETAFPVIGSRAALLPGDRPAVVVEGRLESLKPR
jgi:outer membrane protein assembly factor BamB